MKILVTGGTGTVGSQVVKELVARGASVSVLTRDAGKAAGLPAGVTAVQGNLQDPSTVRRVFDGMDGVFLINPVSPTETHEGLMAVSGIRAAKVKRLVYLSVHNLDACPWAPHFGSKIGVEDAVRKSGVPFTILRPNNFYQNDYWFKDVMLHYGVYPQPIGNTGLSRVDVRDIAEGAAIALTSGGHEGETYDIAGPDVVTGESTAKIWSQALGRPVAYAGDDLDAWEKQSLQFLPDWMVYDFKLMYAHFQAEGLKISPEALAREERLLGHAPRSFEAFAAETAGGWR
jgi:uncharacterized protein YbjT (DUF2867 family)